MHADLLRYAGTYYAGTYTGYLCRAKTTLGYYSGSLRRNIQQVTYTGTSAYAGTYTEHIQVTTQVIQLRVQHQQSVR